MSAGEAPLPTGLRRFLERPRPQRAGERCEMCGAPIPETHSHVARIDNRSLLCACRACYLLFTHEGAAQGKYRAVPERYLYDPAFALGDAEWDALQIPVSMAFFFVNSTLGRFVAFYPSPAGATESLLPLDAWASVMAANPHVADVAPDVEALMLNRGAERTPGRAGERRTECFLVPIDACYELVGRVKLHWRGFAGGDEAWRKIDAFFAGLREQSRRVGAGT